MYVFFFLLCLSLIHQHIHTYIHTYIHTGILCELFVASPILPGQSECEQIYIITRTLGSDIPKEILRKGLKTNNFFEFHKGKFCLKRSKTWRSMSSPVASLNTRLEQVFEKNNYNKDKKDCENRFNGFVHFVRNLLDVDPDLRWNPFEARQHPFLSGKEFTSSFIPSSESSSSKAKLISQRQISPPIVFPSGNSTSSVFSFGSSPHSATSYLSGKSPPFTPMIMSPPMTPFGSNGSSPAIPPPLMGFPPSAMPSHPTHAAYSPTFAQHFVSHIQQQQMYRHQPDYLFGVSAPQRLHMSMLHNNISHSVMGTTTRPSTSSSTIGNSSSNSRTRNVMKEVAGNVSSSKSIPKRKKSDRKTNHRRSKADTTTTTHKLFSASWHPKSGFHRS